MPVPEIDALALETDRTPVREHIKYIYWKADTASHSQSRRSLQCIDDNFLIQLVDEPARRGALLDLLLTNKPGLVEAVKVKGSLGCSDHEMMEFRIWNTPVIMSGESLEMENGGEKCSVSAMSYYNSDFAVQESRVGRAGERPSNASSITQFLLVFADTRELQLLTFGLFLSIYLAALLGNGLTITAIVFDHHLHKPMYFFLFNLSLLDLGSLSTTLPKAMANSLWNTRAISYTGCFSQVFLFLFFIAAEYFLLTVMAYDRYVAICKPLHYGTLLGSRACVHMAAAAWGTAFPYAVLHTANTFSLPLCQGNAVDQFFCEIPQILKLSCSDTYLREAAVLVVSVIFGFVCFVFIVVSYVQIFRAVLRIPSEQGRHKAFSTCLPHLAVVSLFLSTMFFAYLKPPSMSSPSLDLVMAVLYSMVPPAVNPLIYSMRNQELKDAIKKLILCTFFNSEKMTTSLQK
ncbi:olfactory receptor 14A16-like [Leptosomus discolor]